MTHRGCVLGDFRAGVTNIITALADAKRISTLVCITASAMISSAPMHFKSGDGRLARPITKAAFIAKSQVSLLSYWPRHFTSPNPAGLARYSSTCQKTCNCSAV